MSVSLVDGVVVIAIGFDLPSAGALHHFESSTEPSFGNDSSLKSPEKLTPDLSTLKALGRPSGAASLPTSVSTSVPTSRLACLRLPPSFVPLASSLSKPHSGWTRRTTWRQVGSCALCVGQRVLVAHCPPCILAFPSPLTSDFLVCLSLHLPRYFTLDHPLHLHVSPPFSLSPSSPCWPLLASPPSSTTFLASPHPSLLSPPSFPLGAA